MNYQKKTVLLKNGKTCVIRRPEEADAEMLVEYLKAISGETRYVLREPEEVTMTVEQEREFLRRQGDSGTGLMLLAEADGRHAGTASFNGVGRLSRVRVRHRCSVAITLYRAFWGLGIGTALLGEILASAKAAGYEQAELEVVSTNEAAIGLYKKLGFETTGTIPHAMKYKDGTYADFLFMVKRLG